MMSLKSWQPDEKVGDGKWPRPSRLELFGDETL